MSKLSQIMILGFSILGLMACVSATDQTPPKTPESYTISGTTSKGAVTHFINLKEGETLKIRIVSDNPDIVFDIFDANRADRLYNGLTSDRPSMWLSDDASVKRYNVEVYNSANDTMASDVSEYKLEIFQSD